MTSLPAGGDLLRPGADVGGFVVCRRRRATIRSAAARDQVFFG